MEEVHYAVYCDKVKLADNMTLGTALLFIKAYVQEYGLFDNFVMSLHKVSDENDRYEQNLAKLQECKRQIEFEADEKGYEKC